MGREFGTEDQKAYGVVYHFKRVHFKLNQMEPTLGWKYMHINSRSIFACHI